MSFVATRYRCCSAERMTNFGNFDWPRMTLTHFEIPARRQARSDWRCISRRRPSVLEKMLLGLTWVMLLLVDVWTVLASFGPTLLARVDPTPDRSLNLGNSENHRISRERAAPYSFHGPTSIWCGRLIMIRWSRSETGSRFASHELLSRTTPGCFAKSAKRNRPVDPGRPFQLGTARESGRCSSIWINF